MVPFYSLTSQAYRTAFAPVQCAQQQSLKAVERLTRYQLALIRNFVEHNLAGLQAMVSAGTPAQYFARQGELNLNLVRALTTDTQQFLKESSEVVQKFAETIKHSTEGFAATAERAANTSMKQGTEVAEEFTQQVKRQTEEDEEFLESALATNTGSDESREAEESQDGEEQEEAASPVARRPPRAAAGTRRAKQSRGEHH